MKLTEALQLAIDGTAVLFVGSGFSRSAKNALGQTLLTGSELAAFLSKECGLDKVAALDDVADLYVDTKGATGLVKLLVEQFQICELGPEHRAYAKVPWKRIYTTNYDDAVELSYKNQSKTIVPLTLEHNVKRVRESSTQCVHINGFINDLTEETLQTRFKLTDTSYSSSAFADSPWSGQFRHDIAAAGAVIFVGYSAYDLDIKRVLLGTPETVHKTFFIAGTNPDPLARHKLSRFGHVEEEDVAGLATKIENTLETYAPREHFVVTGKYVEEISGPVEQKVVRDRDVFDLFLWGKIDRNLAWTSAVASTTEPYLCTRSVTANCLQLLEDGERDIVVRSDLGNGKTVFLESLGALACALGYSVFYLGESGQTSIAEVELLANCDRKTLLMIDSYTTKREEIGALSKHRSTHLHVVYAARTLRHDVNFDWLHEQLGTDSIPEIDLDRLSEDDCQWFCETLEKYGLWGERAAWPIERKVNYVKSDCGKHVSGVLLAVLESPAIQDRLKTVISSISRADTAYLETITSVMSLSVTETVGRLEVLSNLVGPEILNQAAFRNNEAVRELIDFRGGRVVAKSAVVGRHILTSVVDPTIVVSALAKMARKANDLAADDLYYEILRDLMRFGNVQSVLPLSNKMNAVLVYYENLKNLDRCRANPNFWLQYAIARLALGAYHDARVKLETAYAHAIARPGFNTYMIDNTWARLLLEELIASPTNDRDVAIRSFREARQILNAQVTKLEYRYYPYRVAANYSAFYSVHRDVLSRSDAEEIARAARFILRRIEGLTPYRAGHRYVADCSKALRDILSEVELPDA